MCTYHRPLKNGNIQEFVFELNRNTYELVNILGIIFSFTIEDRFVHFTINCNSFSNQGYGTALMSIMFDIVNTNYNYVDFICGRLSTADYYNGNWNISIPFYLKQKENSFLIKTATLMRYLYTSNSNFNDFFKKYKRYNNYEKFVENISDGYIVYEIP